MRSSEAPQGFERVTSWSRRKKINWAQEHPVFRIGKGRSSGMSRRRFLLPSLGPGAEHQRAACLSSGEKTEAEMRGRAGLRPAWHERALQEQGRAAIVAERSAGRLVEGDRGWASSGISREQAVASGAGLLRAAAARVPTQRAKVCCSSNSAAPGRNAVAETLDQTGSCGPRRLIKAQESLPRSVPPVADVIAKQGAHGTKAAVPAGLVQGAEGLYQAASAASSTSALWAPSVGWSNARMLSCS